MTCYEHTFDQVMHPKHVVDQALALSSEGLTPGEVARRIGIPRSTVRPWIAGHIPGLGPDGQPNRQGGYELRPKALPPSYVYLLGLYLGDGCLSEHARGVFKLRIILDLKYPGIINECDSAMADVRPASRVGRRPYSDAACVEVFSYWKEWPLLFPQHGPGMKHHRMIAGTVAGRARGAVAGTAAARPDPLGRLPLHEHRPRRVAASAVRVLESLRPHPRDLLHGLPATGTALDEGSAHDLRLAEGRRRPPRRVRGAKGLMAAWYPATPALAAIV
jgi:hypothetical protein